MSGGGGRVFVYREGHDTVRGGFLISIYGAGVKMFISAIVDPIMLPGLILVGLFAWLLTSLFLRQRPIAVTEDTIDAPLGRWRWRTIAWRDMDRIEKRVVPEDLDVEGGLLPHSGRIYFRSGGRRIFVTSAIAGFEALKRYATEQAKRRGIRMVAVEPRLLWHAPLVTRLDEL